jgi:hypothetical protein
MQFIVTDKARRPAIDRPICCYCQQPVGSPHKDDCVLIKKKVLIRMTVEYEVSVPASYDKGDVEFHRNEGSWCADNVFDELEALCEEHGCLCGVVNFTCLRDTGEHYLEE